MAIVVLGYLRLGLLYLLCRRFVQRGQWHLIGVVLVVEIVLGITGFYAGFREPLIMAALAFLEVFERRNVRHWATIGALGVVMVAGRRDRPSSISTVPIKPQRRFTDARMWRMR